MLNMFLLPFFAYLLGSIPWGLVLTRLFTSENIRELGSKNIGATNVARIAGTTLGILTLAGDVLKGAFPVWLGLTLTSQNEFGGQIYISLVGDEAGVKGSIRIGNMIGEKARISRLPQGMDINDYFNSYKR